MTSPLIQLHNVNKTFEDKKVLNQLSFSVNAGELVALLGANGAGKTTTINLLLGLEQADSGEISVLGRSPGHLKTRSQLGVTPQGTDFPGGLKVKEILAWVAAHYTHPMAVKQAISEFHLEDIADQHAGNLSYGQKRRIAVALSFISQPKLVFLDEPTTGLDVQSRHALWAIVRRYVDNGGSLVLTTHYLEEAEKLASNILVLNNGAIHSQGTVDEIIANFGSMSISFQADSCPDKLDHATQIERKQNQFVIETTDSDALLRELVQRQVNFHHLAIHKSSLETAFLEMNQAGD